MENVESDQVDERKESEDASQVHVVSQKDIHDFWDHVSTGDRISDVCTTFESESKQVIRKLYEKSASMGEKFAVANFLLQIGALQFRVQKNPEDENELQTIIILQKPDITQSKTDVKDEIQETAEASIHNKNNDDDDTPTAEGVREGNNLAVWEKDPEPEEKGDKAFVPPPPEEHECGICHSVLTSLWELDLHVLNRCSNRPPPRGRPAKKRQEPATEKLASDDEEEADADWKPPLPEKRKRGRPRKLAPSTPSQERQGSGKRKRGRPRKSDSSQEIQGSVERKRGRPCKSNTLAKKLTEKSPLKHERLHKIHLPKPRLLQLQLHKLEETRSKRKRRLPVKLREVFAEEKLIEQDDTLMIDPEEAEPDQIEQDQTEDDQATDAVTEDGDTNEGRDEDEANDRQAESETEDMVQDDTNDGTNKDLNSDDKTGRHEEENSEKMFTCSTCGKAYKVKTMFRQHLIMHRNKAMNSKFECEVCSRVFYDKFELKNHRKVHKQTFNCDFCDKAFTHISHLNRHRNNVHTKEISYPCTLCDKVFYLKNRLKDHMVTHSGKREFSCDMCKMKFFLLSQLKTHKKTVHVEGKPYLCDLCGSSFKSKGILKQHHLTVHTDIKKFPCRQCGKLFSRSSLRNQHEKVHSGLNPYPCEHCGKGFRDKFKLKVHVNWHLGVHPFTCNLCEKTFLVKGNLTKHMRIHTGERPYVCEQCGRGCVDSSQLKKHMAQAHKIHISRILTKGPERSDGELPSTRRKRKKTDPPLISHPVGESAETQETQAYTIATDALIEISQQLADMSNTVHIPAQSGDLVVDAKPGEGHPNMHQQAESSVVSSNVPNGASTPGASTDGTIFPVVIQVSDQNNQVTVPVTQSIGDFQSLELITL